MQVVVTQLMKLIMKMFSVYIQQFDLYNLFPNVECMDAKTLPAEFYMAQNNDNDFIYFIRQTLLELIELSRVIYVLGGTRGV